MKQFILLSFVAIIILGGCSSQKTAIKKYYLIEQPGIKMEKSIDASTSVNAWCEVENVEVYPAFATRQIVFRDDSHQIRYFGDHEWAVRPSEVLTPVIIDYLSAQKVFTRVADRFWKHNPAYKISTTIMNLEVGETNKKDFETHLQLRFELIDARADTIAISHMADRKSVLEEKKLNLFAASISKIFNEELEKFSNQIREELSDQ